MDVKWISSGHEEKAWGINTYTSGVWKVEWIGRQPQMRKRPREKTATILLGTNGRMPSYGTVARLRVSYLFMCVQGTWLSS